MSIAVSAIILPSRILAGMLVFMFVIANAAIGYAGYSAELNKIYLLIIILVNSLLSVAIFLGYYRRQHSVRLDISDSGDILLRGLGSKPSHFETLNVRLSERSTFWPQMMLLSFRSEEGQSVVLPILQDSVDAATYRKLAVALNWIATHASSRTIFGANVSSGNF